MKSFIKSFPFILFLLATSCQHDDVPVTYEQGTTEYTNNWMYTQMKRYYYWNENMPAKGDLSVAPKDYFSRLLSPEDRFSYALNLADINTFPKSLRNSFGFDIGFVEHEGQVFGVILYVLSDSPAKNAGLRRGQLINAIGSINLNRENYNSLYNGMITSQEARLQIMNYTETTGFSQPQEVTISSGIVLLQHVSGKVLHEQGKIVGYIEIPHFDVGLSQSLLNVFSLFKSQNVNEIVVDLRYNGGGDVSSATALCALLAPNIAPNDFFIRFTGNTNGGTVNQSFKEALQTNESQVSFEALRAAHPAIQRVYILCGGHTASASEIIINNLRPFMEVITIGEKTLGKDTATFPIEDENAGPDVPHWVLYPAIYKLSNANEEGNYSSGLIPSITIDELGELELHALGKPDEILLERAFSNISGNGRLRKSRNAIQLHKERTDHDAQPIVIDKKWPY